ncbi:hypothetical protein JZ751_001058 [Albula glossodonta]|uniref:Uncharacterized protein n=1 Tax=Albula glossodonta TaxID=121402 RepID=A0A8T2PSF6_9TELE|nr:hypothetical protein JZ751_001058 [Albula glossodonta]
MNTGQTRDLLKEPVSCRLERQSVSKASRAEQSRPGQGRAGQSCAGQGWSREPPPVPTLGPSFSALTPLLMSDEE